MNDFEKFTFNDLVWHRTSGSEPGIVTGILYEEKGVLFRVEWQGRIIDFHPEGVLSKERPKYRNADDDDDEGDNWKKTK